MPPANSKAWWLKGQSDAERALMAVEAQKIICGLPAETYRRDYDLFNVRLYENNPNITLYNFAGRYYAEASTLALPLDQQSANNKAKAAIDTLAAQIFSTDQRARFITVDGTNKQRRRAFKMQEFADGLALDLKLHSHRKRAGKDSCILESGVGVLQFYRKDGRCAVQRCIASEFSIDPLDGQIDGQFRTLYRRRPVPRDTVRHDFAEDASADVQARIETIGSVATAGAPADHIEVFEAWHLPEGEGSEDGWHVIALEDGTPLLVERHRRPYHDCVFFAIEERFTTGWGLSLMTQARPLQLRINRNDYRIERAQKLFHAGLLYVNKASKVKKTQLSNEIGAVLEGNGDTPPQRVMFECASPELYTQIERDGQRIFENLGISQSASQAETDSGLNASAAAKREDKARGNERNADRQQRWEQNHLDCMRVALGIVRDIVTHNDEGEQRSKPGSYKVGIPGKRNGLTVHDWSDIAMDEKDYVAQIKPASPIPTEPAGLVAFGERMIELQAWKPSDLAGYMQDLDADGRVNRQMSQQRQLEDTFEAMLYDKVAAAVPDEFTNFKLALEIGPDYLAQGYEDKVEEKHLERIRRYLKRCKAMDARAQAAIAAAQAPPPGQPAAVAA